MYPSPPRGHPRRPAYGPDRVRSRPETPTDDVREGLIEDTRHVAPYKETVHRVRPAVHDGIDGAVVSSAMSFTVPAGSSTPVPPSERSPPVASLLLDRVTPQRRATSSRGPRCARRPPDALGAFPIREGPVPWAALLDDIGKLHVPAKILNKLAFLLAGRKYQSTTPPD
jgi:hypothetical protein